MIKDRLCYLHDTDEEGRLNVPVPMFREEHPGSWVQEAEEDKVISREEFVEVLSDIEEIFPDMPVFEMVRTYFKRPKEMCITAFGDPELEVLIREENRAETYHVLPFHGGQLDQPLVVLEAFDVIRITKAWYQLVKMDRQDQVTKMNRDMQTRRDAGKSWSVPVSIKR